LAANKQRPRDQALSHIWHLLYNKTVTLRRVTFWVDDELADALKAIKARDGIPEAEQLRRAIRAWVGDRGPVTRFRESPGLPRPRQTKGRTTKKR